MAPDSYRLRGGQNHNARVIGCADRAAASLTVCKPQVDLQSAAARA